MAPDGGFAELKELIESGNKEFHAYRDATDERIEEIKRHGVERPETADKLSKMDAALDTIKDKIEANQRSAQKAVDELEARMNVQGLAGRPEHELERATAAARFFTTARNNRVRPVDAVNDLETYDAYCAAFFQLALAQGNPDVLPSDIRAALNVGSDPGGGYLAPTEMSMDMERRIFETSPMRSIARVRTIGRTAWEAPYKDNATPSGGWVGEKQARTATASPTVGMQRIETHSQYAYPEVTEDMLDDAELDVESFLVDDVEDTMGRTENTAFVSGTGVLKPKGFLHYKDAAVTTADATRSWGVLQYVLSGAAGGFPQASGVPGASDPDALITIVGELNPAYRANARWTMARRTEAAIRKLKDGDGRYFIGFGDIREGVFGFSLFGFPITNLEDMPALASDSFSVAFGDFMRGYYIIDRRGFRLLRDPFTNKPYVGFYITKRTGGDVRNFDAIKLMKFAAS